MAEFASYSFACLQPHTADYKQDELAAVHHSVAFSYRTFGCPPTAVRLPVGLHGAWPLLKLLSREVPHGLWLAGGVRCPMGDSLEDNFLCLIILQYE